MRITKTALIVPVAAAMMLSCSSSRTATYQVERTRILIDSSSDAHADRAAIAFMAPYKAHVDSLMNPVVGYAASDMSNYQPESPLSNLFSDILVWGGQAFNEHPDFAVYNVGGIRASLSKGPVTIGDVLDMAPFENKICFLTLTGSKVLELFQQITSQGGQGVSHSVRLVMDKDGKLLSATVNGEPVNKTKEYRIATLDYVAQGNDNMDAFKAKTNVVSPQSEENNIRYIIMNYFRYFMKQGKAVESKVEGRITIEK